MELPCLGCGTPLQVHQTSERTEYRSQGQHHDQGACVRALYLKAEAKHLVQNQVGQYMKLFYRTKHLGGDQ